jgi:hypothetical protein
MGRGVEGEPHECFDKITAARRLLPADGIVTLLVQAAVDEIFVNRAWTPVVKHFMNNSSGCARCGTAGRSSRRAYAGSTDNRTTRYSSGSADRCSGAGADPSAF